MNKRNNAWIIAGGINFFVAFVHLIGGQIDLVNPLLESSLTTQVKTELLGVWHTITVGLFASSYILLINGLKGSNPKRAWLIKQIGNLYLLISIVFIIVSLVQWTLAPQWILLLPIAGFSILGYKRFQTEDEVQK